MPPEAGPINQALPSAHTYHRYHRVHKRSRVHARVIRYAMSSCPIMQVRHLPGYRQCGWRAPRGMRRCDRKHHPHGTALITDGLWGVGRVTASRRPTMLQRSQLPIASARVTPLASLSGRLTVCRFKTRLTSNIAQNIYRNSTINQSVSPSALQSK